MLVWSMDFYTCIETRYANAETWEMFATSFRCLNFERNEYSIVFGGDWRSEHESPWVLPTRGLPTDLSEGGRALLDPLASFDVVVQSYITLDEVLSDRPRAERVVEAVGRMRRDDGAIMLLDQTAFAGAYFARQPTSLDLVCQAIELMVIAARSVGADNVRWVCMAIE